MVPTGTIISYAGPVNGQTEGRLSEQGWLLCDGRQVNRRDYRALFDTIGSAWGAGDNTSTFNLPDLRGYFLRGVDHGAGHDPDAQSRQQMHPGSGNNSDNVGSFQIDMFANHSHSYTLSQADTNSWKTGNPGDGYVVNLYGSLTGCAGGNETRPRNVYVEFLIYFRGEASPSGSESIANRKLAVEVGEEESEDES